MTTEDHPDQNTQEENAQDTEKTTAELLYHDQTMSFFRLNKDDNGDLPFDQSRLDEILKDPDVQRLLSLLDIIEGNMKGNRTLHRIGSAAWFAWLGVLFVDMANTFTGGSPIFGLDGVITIATLNFIIKVLTIPAFNIYVEEPFQKLMQSFRFLPQDVKQHLCQSQEFYPTALPIALDLMTDIKDQSQGLLWSQKRNSKNTSGTSRKQGTTKQSC